MIMEHCKDLLPDYFGFVRGIVDSADLSLNISREMLQHDKQLKVIARAIEKKIKSELSSMMEADREKYEKFFDEFGIQLKYGVYSDYGMHKDTLKDLLLFKSSSEGKYLSLKQYVEGMKQDQQFIFYASGETVEKIEMLPKVATAKARGYEVLYLTDDVDEFALRVLESYEDKEFKNVTADMGQEDDKDNGNEVKAENESKSDLLEFMKNAIGEVSAVRFTSSLGEHPVCLTTEGDLSAQMERVLKKMPGAESGIPEAKIIMEININHPIKDKLVALFESDKDTLESYSKLLYAQGRLIGGMNIENPAELCQLMQKLMI
jgi:molecular chaperone HtpG